MKFFSGRSRPNRPVRSTRGRFSLRLELLEDRTVPAFVVNEFALPNADSGIRWIAAGPDGNVWVSDINRSAFHRIAPDGQITEVPTINRPYAFAFDTNANIWFTDRAGNILQVNQQGQYLDDGPFIPWSVGSGGGYVWGLGAETSPAGTPWLNRISPDGAVSQFEVYTEGLSYIDGRFVSTPDGNVWLTDVTTNPDNQHNQMAIARIHPDGSSEVFDIHGTPSEVFLDGRTLSAGLAVGPDGNLWLPQVYRGPGSYSRLLRINLDGQVTGQFDVPAWSDIPSGALSEVFMVAGADGALWATEPWTNKIARIAMDGSVTEVSLPEGHSAYRIAAGPDGNIWFVEQGAGDDLRGRPLGNVIGQIVLNQPPIALAGGPHAIAEGQSLTLDGSASHDLDMADVLTYSWDVNDDGAFGDATGVSPTVSWAQLVVLGLNDGLHVNNVRVRVDDGHGHVVDSAATTLTISNAPPTVAVNGPTNGHEFQAYSFTFAANDPSVQDQAGAFTYRIDWEGDGIVDQTITAGNSVAVNHTFMDDDSFDITVTATDRDAAEGPATIFTFDAGDCDGAAGSAVLDADGNLTIIGTDGNDQIRLRPGATPGSVKVRVSGQDLGTFTLAPAAKIYVCAGAGNDQIRLDHRIGNDAVVHGDAGNDRLWGGGGNDVLLGDAGNDRLYARCGNDLLDGGADNDELRGGDGYDTLLGAGGNDKLWGGCGSDLLDGGADDDDLHAGQGNDTLLGGVGKDELWGGAGGDLLDGGADNDKLHASSGGDTLLGGDGNDVLKGGQGCDWLYGGAGNDSINGGAGDDVMLGEAGDDLLMGDDGRDLMIGGVGADRISGNADEDILIAGFTAFDGNALALDAVMGEWRSNGSNAVRIANIQGGTGLTQGFRLDGDDGASQTVFNDNDIDVLTGGAAVDWYFANRSADNGGVLDFVTDLKANELWNDTDF